MKPLQGTLLAGLVLALGLCAPGVVKGQDQKPDEQTIERKTVAPEADDTDTNNVTSEGSSKHRKGIHREAIVVIGRDVELKEDETAEAVIVIGGKATIHGEVKQAAVVIGGDMDVDGAIGDAAVAIMGNIKASKGAEIMGNTVTVGGKLETTDGVTIHGNPVEVDPLGLGHGLRSWFVHCVLKLRPLAPQVGWVWAIAGAFAFIYFLVALILPTPVQACVSELTRRPVTTFFLGILTKLLVPLVLVLLVATGVGAFVAPFVIAALLFGVIVGKVALMEFIGSGIGRRFGLNILPLGGFVIGILLITLLYMVPLLGLITFAVVSLWGLGGVVTATYSGLRREMPERPIAPIPPAPMPGPAPAMTENNPSVSALGASPPAMEPTPSTTATPSPSVTMPLVPDTVTFPKAGFWERMGAAFLDLLLVGIVAGSIGRPPIGFLLTLAYFVAMWVWKGTTVGGVVLGLKVVRLDGQPITLTVAIVRALAGAFSTIVFFLGILWIALDRDKQGWHDRIAGTVVLRMPKGTPLVLF